MNVVSYIWFAFESELFYLFHLKNVFFYEKLSFSALETQYVSSRVYAIDDCYLWFLAVWSFLWPCQQLILLNRPVVACFIIHLQLHWLRPLSNCGLNGMDYDGQYIMINIHHRYATKLSAMHEKYDKSTASFQHPRNEINSDQRAGLITDEPKFIPHSKALHLWMCSSDIHL